MSHIFQFEAGDVVSLRSGGPLMTVTAAERIPVDKPVDPKAAPSAAPVDPKAPPVPVPPKDMGPAVKCIWQATDAAGEVKSAEGTWPAGLLDLKDRIDNHAHHMAAAAAKIAAVHAASTKAAGVTNLHAGPLDRVAAA
jgi:hypothetical protein